MSVGCKRHQGTIPVRILKDGISHYQKHGQRGQMGGGGVKGGSIIEKIWM